MILATFMPEPVTRARQGDDYERERINGQFSSTNYNILYNLAESLSERRSPRRGGLGQVKGQVNAEEIWTFIWYNAKYQVRFRSKNNRLGIISLTTNLSFGVRVGMTMRPLLPSNAVHPKVMEQTKK